ncbi:redoxin family protein [Planctomicrobium sp. SH668]|uniref:redoxin family protein n=1 Tax=Planctomicrobium sp. SH668 TaxID=3448126 RepID=UPI003F5C72C0
MKRFLAYLMIFALILAPHVMAGEYNDVLSIGDPAPQWKDLPGVDGIAHSLSDLAEKDVVVVVFTCVSCPTAADYEVRINELHKKYATEGKVGIVAICVNRVADDKLPALTARAQEKGLEFPYLYDESQKVARDFGAVFTPEFYVLNRERKVVYMGAMDDATDASKVTKHFVDAAIQSAINGTELQEKEVIARGCRVRYVKERRRPE